MSAESAGAYKWKCDEYQETKGPETLLTRGWQAKEEEKLRAAVDRTVSGSKFSQSPKTASFGTPEDLVHGFQSGEAGHAPMRHQPVDWRPRKALPSVAGFEGWGWCRTKGGLLDVSDRAPAPAPIGAMLGRTLSSPSMLTFEGRAEAGRVLGARPPHLVEGTLVTAGRQAAEGSRPNSGLREAALSKFDPPKTCNQIYGSRTAIAETPLTKFNKNSCDVCLFVDSMHKTKTSYCPQIRF
eukprot:TRINITY_DN11164_c0_g1_i2.p1 TRINITY_DN11164_c0_g1~~TRINITY_DN11164_c0_g1_i2.p1  ORF type:complete len:268 (-),score=36.34 TRINITY_DN11164_c0_g1_i2:53-769(-)